MKVGCIGKNLETNFTKDVFHLFGIKDYETKEMDFDELVNLVNKKQFNFINITYPYTKDIIDYIDIVSEEVNTSGIVDTIIVRDGMTYGYNINYETDNKLTTKIELLVIKCKQTIELATNAKISNEKVKEVIHSLLIDKSNIVLIGMPSSGKTTIGHMLTEIYDKKFIDMDEVIVEDTNKSIPEIFAESGEEGFRKLETMTAYKLGKMNSLIIGTGGGTIKNKINMDYLRRNGIIIFIDRSLDKLVTYDPNRPLSSSKEAVAKLYEERYALYKKYADSIVLNNDDINETINSIVKAFEEACTINNIE